MMGLKTLIVDKQMVLAAIQEYLDKSVTPHVSVISVAPWSNQYSQNPVVIPDAFQIIVEPNPFVRGWKSIVSSLSKNSNRRLIVEPKKEETA